MKLELRVSVRKIISIELIVAALSFLVATVLPATHDLSLTLFGICLLHAVIYAPIGFFEGFDFVMYDEHPQSPLKFYHFLSIFIATYIAVQLFDTFAQMTEEIRVVLNLGSTGMI